LGDLYSKCVQMVNENKISTKNAFDLDLIDHMDDIVDSFMGGRKKSASASGGERRKSVSQPPKGGDGAGDDNRFHEASCTIEASARIYACRVDCVHTDTYRVLGGLSSADVDEDDGKEGEDGKATKKRRIVGVNTLERNEANIVQQNIEADEQSDPMFRRMAAAFDAGGAKGLLLSHLPIAEDLSLVFNGDVSLTRAAEKAKPMFLNPTPVPVDALGLGNPADACAKIAEGRLCPEVDQFRQVLYGNVSMEVSLSPSLDALLGQARPANVPGSSAVALGLAPPLEDGDVAEGDFFDGAGPADDGAPCDNSEPVFGGAGGMPSMEPASGRPGAPPLPLADAAEVLLADGKPGASAKEDVIAFDELFEKFCGVGGQHQFAYFDECWGKLARDKDGKVAAAIADEESATVGADGVLVPKETPAAKERPNKRPLFDLSGLDKPAKPIETEHVQKHQLSERAAQWQLHKDVPPYMIDRITMPSWPTWSKCDFACLGLRPHLMLKLVRKPQPTDDGPQNFTDLFSTVVVENPDAFPWLAADTRGLAAAGDEGNDEIHRPRDAQFQDDVGDEDFDGSGLPAHLDVDPQDLFLRPDDKVVPGCDQEDFSGGGNDTSFVPDLDFDLVDQPTTVGSTEIGYSRNSKFVDVKLVKKHLWDCINDDISDMQSSAKRLKTTSSFQDLVTRTVQRLPKSETENLSVQVCFICALHLCNEKGLELACDPNKPLGDFSVLGSA